MPIHIEYLYDKGKKKTLRHSLFPSNQKIRRGSGFTEAFPFTLRLRLIRNPNMALNGRFPTAVGDFKYEINR
jgi:hypothetical protein